MYSYGGNKVLSEHFRNVTCCQAVSLACYPLAQACLQTFLRASEFRNTLEITILSQVVLQNTEPPVYDSSGPDCTVQSRFNLVVQCAAMLGNALCNVGQT